MYQGQEGAPAGAAGGTPGANGADDANTAKDKAADDEDVVDAEFTDA